MYMMFPKAVDTEKAHNFSYKWGKEKPELQEGL